MNHERIACENNGETSFNHEKKSRAKVISVFSGESREKLCEMKSKNQK